jgi:iron complex transport system ATP-binding protein
LARVLAQEPQLILLDEPTNHLDLKYQLELIAHLSKWSQRENRAVIAVLHDLNLTLSFANRVLLLKEGEVAAFGGADSILDSELLESVYNVDVKKYMMSSLKKWLD